MTRISETAVDVIFLDRWSPRAFDSSSMPDADITTILDAARWAPSSFNYQPWRFLYATRNHTDWARFLMPLIPFNRDWAKNASVLIYVCSERTMGAPDKPSHSHSFDAGAAWAYLALQASLLGYHAHGMTGVDFDAARQELEIPELFRIEAAVAVGRKGEAAALPEILQSREYPSDRKPLSSIAYRGSFRG